MSDNQINDLILLVKDLALVAFQRLSELNKKKLFTYSYSKDIPREMKAKVDNIIEDLILNRLNETGLPILSEENGDIEGNNNSDLRFIVDPIDGTVNFIRGLAPSTISIALYKGNQPLFGVLVVYPSGDLVWGGKGMGAFINNQPIEVSKIIDLSDSVLCTGIPSSFDFDDKDASIDYYKSLASYAKIRMLGSASYSLLQVAKGSAEAYSEVEIMLWDVAAGLAIVEGAGGFTNVLPGKSANSINVYASNGVVKKI
ncbi:inositol monophosphatase [Candidatus Pseudothioglobus singularis]|nr:inositol monophosphatase [Candidatus Pseudothioglobus singularis]